MLDGWRAKYAVKSAACERVGDLRPAGLVAITQSICVGELFGWPIAVPPLIV